MKPGKGSQYLDAKFQVFRFIYVAWVSVGSELELTRIRGRKY